MQLDKIIKYIEGTASRVEKDEMESWLLEDPGNQQYLEKVKKVWFAVDELKALSLIDVNKDWDAVEKRISGRSGNLNRPARKKQVRLLPWAKIAAVFVLGIIMASLFFYLRQDLSQNSKLAGHPYELNIPDGQKSDIVLPDGTKIMINAGSKLLFPGDFYSNPREVWLEGEAFFEVTKNAKSPFLVHTAGMDMKVLGTTFNVRAYSGEDIIETTLVEGKVVLSTQEGGKEVALEPNHKAILIKSKDAEIPAGIRREFETLKTGEIIVSGLINPEEAVSWTKGKLIFENEYLDVIARRLEKFYGVKIRIEDPGLKKLRYTGTLKKVSVEKTLKALQLTTSFGYTEEDNEIILYKTKKPMEN
jgi:ferric-dicitrate binding protein FerR (iron transport regulator)